MSCSSLDDKDFLSIFDHDKLWEFTFFIDGCCFMVLLAPYKQVHDLLTEAQKVFNSLFQKRRWEHFNHILHCQKHERFWNVKRKNVAIIQFYTVFSIFNNKDTIYCIYEKTNIELPDVTFLVLLGHCTCEAAHDRLLVALQTVEENVADGKLDCPSYMYDWVSRKIKTEDFVVKVINLNKCLVSQKHNRKKFEEKTLKTEPNHLRSETMKSRRKKPRWNSFNSDINSDFLNSGGSLMVTKKSPKITSTQKVNNSAGKDDCCNILSNLPNRNDQKKKIFSNGDGCTTNVVKDTAKKSYRNYLVKHKFYYRKRTAQLSRRFLAVKSKRRFHRPMFPFLTKKDFNTLLPGNWLNDEIINCYLKLISSWSQFKNVYVFNTFFYTCLKNRGYNGVSRWTKKVDIFQNDLVMFPVHIGGVHWTLIVADILKKIIACYDSMKTSSRSEVSCKVIKDYLRKEQKAKHYNTQNWSLRTFENIPTQKNTDDCGVFVCLYAKCLALGLPMNFTQVNIKMARKLMAKELQSGRLFVKIY